MAQLRLKGLPLGSNPGTISATIGSDSGSAIINSFLKPVVQTQFPTLSDANTSETLVPDNNGIPVTTRIWRNAQTQAVLGNGATLPAAGLMNQYIEYSPDNGSTWSPALRVYPTSMMGEAMDPAHIRDDTAMLKIMPHGDATHIAVADGLWSDPATWHDAEVPGNGACVLVPHPRQVTYDMNAPGVRLDRVRVDGRLDWPVDQSTSMLVETLLGTRGATRTMGTGPSNRVQANVSHTITISGKDYSSLSYTATDLKASAFAATRGWARGILWMGSDIVWGNKKLPWGWAAAPVPSGATSLTMDRDLTGWVVGDKIRISGMDLSYTYIDAPHSPDYQWEERTITNISGRTVSWATPLVFPHDNTLPGSTRTDLTPGVMLIDGRNITQTSEVTEPHWRRGHYANVHGAAVVDLWDMQCIEMGRTSKSVPAGAIDSNGDFDSRDGGANGRTQVPLTAQSNITGKYAFHSHHTGLMPNTNKYVNCFARGTPGWMHVHHGSRVDFIGCTGADWFSGGLVSEDGSELGAWTSCYFGFSSHVMALQGDNDYDNLNTNYKTLSGSQGLGGDPFRHGEAYGYRGRALTSNGNMASDCYLGHAFLARANSGDNLLPGAVTNLRRDQVDLKDVGLAQKPFDADRAGYFNQFSRSDYPIIHFADNKCRAVFSGGSVVKNIAQQRHDYGIRMKRFQNVGFLKDGWQIEYVNRYMMEDFDVITGNSGRNDAAGLVVGANSYAVGYVNGRVEGGEYAFAVDRSDLESADGNYTPDDPRYVVPGMEDVDTNRKFASFANSGKTKSFSETSFLEEDWNDTILDYSQDPVDTYPLILGVYTGGSFTPVTNSQGSKQDRLSNVGKLLPPPNDNDVYIPGIGNGGRIEYQRHMEVFGYWQYDGKDVIVLPVIISDRLTGRPTKQIKLIEATDTSAGNISSNGPLTYASTPVSQTDKTAVVAVNGSVTIDVVAGATGGNGTFEIDERDTPQPDHGRYTVNNATGEVTYTPFVDFEGRDELFCFIKSGNRYKTVRVAIRVGTLNSLTDPTTSDFSVADGPGQSINVTLNDAPEHGGRGIRIVMYSTDNGSTWRRLCHRWIKAVHTITTESDGTALSNGSYNVRIRYGTYYDYSNSGASANTAVTVT